MAGLGYSIELNHCMMRAHTVYFLCKSSRQTKLFCTPPPSHSSTFSPHSLNMTNDAKWNCRLLFDSMTSHAFNF